MPATQPASAPLSVWPTQNYIRLVHGIFSQPSRNSSDYLDVSASCCTLENVVMRRQHECYWPDGCDKLARVALGDGRYCLRHHRLNEGQADRAADPAPAIPRQRRLPGARPAMLACLDLDHWDDAATATLHLGAMDVRCELCGSWNFVADRPSICCHNAKCSHLPSFPDAPNLMQRLLLGRDRRSRRFRMCLRRYNAALSFVSFGAKIQTLV